MNKKGMAIGQVFMFIVMVITFGVLMLFGYKAIAGFLEKGQQVEFVQFKNDLEAAVQRISTDYGSVRVENFYLPPSYEEICFINADYDSSLAQREMPLLCQKNVVACSVWEDVLASGGFLATDENTFLLPPAPVKIKVAPLSISEGTDADGNPFSRGYLCVPILRGKFSLQLSGFGDHTEISEFVSGG